MKNRSYILLTAARNEEKYISKTIDSVISQTILPQKWVIASDGSTDRTDEIVTRYAASHDFIKLIRTDSNTDRNFGSKASAINFGYNLLRNTECNYVGILDADVSFESNYYESIINIFEDNPSLGIAGGLIFDKNKNEFKKQNISMDWSVSGAVQMFRKQCFDKIGGYKILQSGIDTAAEVMARMNGWNVKTYPEFKVLHYRPTGSQKSRLVKALFQQGVESYVLGFHPIFYFLKSLFRFTDKPYIASGLTMLCGYYWAWFQKKERQVPESFVTYLREEQLNRIKAQFTIGKVYSL